MARKMLLLNLGVKKKSNKVKDKKQGFRQDQQDSSGARD
jgi:hypothetical protein